MAALTGELTFATVEAALGRAGDARGELDLSGVTRTDSAGLALLLELTRRAKAGGGTLRLVNTPAQVASLARFFGVAEILGIQA